MPIAKFQMPDGRIARFEVPEGTTPEQAQAMIEAEVNKPSFAEQLNSAKEASSREMMTHNAPKRTPKDMYGSQAQSQGFGENLLAGAGGATYGMFNLGPRSLVGLDKPGEVKDWKASMAGLGSTVGGTLGQVLGYAGPAAVVAPFVGSSVPVAAGMGAIEGAMMPAESLAERGANTAFAAGGGALGQAGGNALARRATTRAANKTAEVAKRKSQNAVRDLTLAASKKEGYVVPPSYAGTGLFPRFMEGISGKYKTNQLAGIKNQQVTNSLARRALGIADDAPLTDDALDAYRKVAAQPYRDVASLPPKKTVAAASNFTDWDQPVQAVKGFDPADALEKLKQARFEAKQYWRHNTITGDPDSYQQAIKMDRVAADIENAIDNYASQNGSPELVNRLRDARTKIAKSYTVEKALNEGTGNIDATKLGRMIERGDMLTGDLETAGKFGMAFNDVARPPKSGDANPLTALDFMTGVLSSGVGGSAWGGPGAMTLAMLPPAVRVGSRYSLLSAPMQRAIVKPKYSIGMVNKVLPGLLDNPLSNAVYPGAGVYGYGVLPNQD